MAKNVFGMKDEEIKKVFRSVRAPRTTEAEIKALEEEIEKEQKKTENTNQQRLRRWGSLPKDRE
jgi:hypothetical protein